MKLLNMMSLTLLLSLGLSAQENQGYEVGDIASDFELKNVDGNMVSLSDYESAKGFIVIFSCNHCPYVKAYEDRMVALDKKYKGEGYPVIAINSNNAEEYPSDSYENMKKRAEKKGFTFPYLRDKTQEVAKKYGAKRTPHVFLLQKTDKGPKVVYEGAIDDNVENPEDVEQKYVEQAIQALENGQQPEPARRRDPRLGPAQCLLFQPHPVAGQALQLPYRYRLRRPAEAGPRGHPVRQR
jgi:peroxiredoxin